MTTRRQRTKPRGFTLIETLAAMALFAIVASGASALAIQSMRHLAANRHGTHAAMIAQEEMEYQRGLDYASMTTRSYSRSMANQTYTVSAVVTPNDPGNNMTRIRVTISWTSAEGDKSYAVESVFTAPEA